MAKQRAKKREQLIIAAMSVIPIASLTAGDIVGEATMYGLHAHDGRSIVPDLKRLMAKGKVIKDHCGKPTYWRLSEAEEKRANQDWIARGGPYTKGASETDQTLQPVVHPPMYQPMSSALRAHMWFKTARKSLGLTQAQLAMALRLGKDGKRAVQRWEAGERPISGPVAVAIGLMLREAPPEHPTTVGA